jgi:hypothetical protein
VRKLIFGFVFLISSTFCSAHIVLFTPEIQNTLSGGIMMDTNTGFSPYIDCKSIFVPSCFFSYKFEMPQLFAESGVRFSVHTVDFTASTVYWPLFWNRLNVGAGVTYHFLSYNGMFFEQDILPGVFFRYRDRGFTLTTDVDYFYKWTRIYAVEKNIPWLTNKSLAVRSTWNWFIFNHLDFYFCISSYSVYQYYLFFAPNFMTGFDWRFKSGLIAGAEFNIQYIDMMTLSSCFNSCEIRLFTKWVF